MHHEQMMEETIVAAGDLSDLHIGNMSVCWLVGLTSLSDT